MIGEDRNLLWSLVFSLLGLMVALWIDKSTGLTTFGVAFGWAGRYMWGENGNH
jgi:hypothetical protein